MPLFSPIELQTINPAGELLPKCDACRIHATGCKTPFMPYAGEGRKKILVLGEAPGADEDQAGRQFVGRAGEELSKRLRKMGIDLRTDCWTYNAVSCRPLSNDLTKYPNAVSHCRANVIKTVRELRPKIIIPVGAKAVESLMGWLWREDVGPIGRWVSFVVPHRRLNCWIVPNYHPAHLLYQSHDEALSLLADRYYALAAACVKAGRPWDQHEAKRDFTKEVQVIVDPVKAAILVQNIHRQAKLIAYDFETNMLKPDHKESRIYSCSISDGEMTIAFPWHGKILLRAMKRLLADPKVEKVGSNIKFEDRWTRCQLGIEVQGWHRTGDTMLTAHALDNGEKASQKKPGRAISSVKFQAFVLLGVEPWDQSVAPYLKSSESEQDKHGGYARNRIHQCDMQSLLTYNGLDSLYEIMVHLKQKERVPNDTQKARHTNHPKG